MNYLKQYIDLRGLTCHDIAAGTGFGYHSIQKTIKNTQKYRRSPQIRTAIAEYLGLDPTKTWSRGSVIYLRRMVAIEANRVADAKALKAKRDFLSKYGASADNLTAKRGIVNV